ncbi:MAG TPA: hypothetical protein VH590_09565, partial [Ktedonobacterales bacterium]
MAAGSEARFQPPAPAMLRLTPPQTAPYNASEASKLPIVRQQREKESAMSVSDDTVIQDIVAREILDSRGNPT